MVYAHTDCLCIQPFCWCFLYHNKAAKFLQNTISETLLTGKPRVVQPVSSFHSEKHYWYRVDTQSLRKRVSTEMVQLHPIGLHWVTLIDIHSGHIFICCFISIHNPTGNGRWWLKISFEVEYASRKISSLGDQLCRIVELHEMIHWNKTRVLASCSAHCVPIHFPLGNLFLMPVLSNWCQSLICDWWRQLMSGFQHIHLGRNKTCCCTDSSQILLFIQRALAWRHQ